MNTFVKTLLSMLSQAADPSTDFDHCESKIKLKAILVNKPCSQYFAPRTRAEFIWKELVVSVLIVCLFLWFVCFLLLVVFFLFFNYIFWGGGIEHILFCDFEFNTIAGSLFNTISLIYTCTCT